MEWFSGKETGIAVYEEWRKAFEHIATCVRGPLRELAVFMAGADNTDKQFYNCEGVKAIQYLLNYVASCGGSAGLQRTDINWLGSFWEADSAKSNR